MTRNEQLNLLVFLTLFTAFSSNAKYSSTRLTEEKKLSSKISLSQENAVVRPGRTLAVSCKSSSHVQWRAPGGKKLGPRTRPAVRDFIGIGKVLIFNDTRVTDAGNYTCVANGTQKTFSLAVAEALLCKRCQDLQSGKEGQVVTLTCGLKCGDDGGSVIWSVEENKSYIELTSPKYEMDSEGLIIRNLRPKDARRDYVCLVTGKLGDIQTCRIRLKVQHKPYFKEDLQREELPNRTLANLRKSYVADDEIYIEDGELVNLTCEIHAEPPARFDWFAVHKRNNSRKVENTLLINATLSILQVQKSNSVLESYKCLATNPHGKLEKNFNLHLAYRPDAPLAINLVQATSDSLELKLDVQERLEALPAVLFIMYRKVDSSQWEELETNINNGSVVVQNLESNSKYGVKAALRNIVGMSNFTDFVFFQTLPSSAATDTSIFAMLFLMNVLHCLYKKILVS